jgi:hypothetical protein
LNETKAVDQVALNALVAELTPLLAENKFAAIGRFHDLQALVTGTPLAEQIDALYVPMQDMRFDLVLQRLHHIMDHAKMPAQPELT